MPIRINLENHKEEIINHYVNENVSAEKISKLYNCDGNTIIKRLKEWGIQIKNASDSRKQLKINEDYFEKIDTERKSYFLGLLYADGSIVKNINKGRVRNSISLGLQKEDKYLLEEFNKEIDLKSPLIKYRFKKGTSDFYKTNINRQKLVDDIIKVGCVPQKSLILKFPTEEQVPKQLLHHFIRGYFDGDGCFYTNEKNNVLNTIILGSIYFIEELSKVLLKLNIKHSINKPFCTKHEYTKELRISKTGTLKFIEFIYKNCNIKMERKFNKIKNFILNNYQRCY